MKWLVCWCCLQWTRCKAARRLAENSSHCFAILGGYVSRASYARGTCLLGPLPFLPSGVILQPGILDMPKCPKPWAAATKTRMSFAGTTGLAHYRKQQWWCHPCMAVSGEKVQLSHRYKPPDPWIFKLKCCTCPFSKSLPWFESLPKIFDYYDNLVVSCVLAVTKCLINYTIFHMLHQCIHLGSAHWPLNFFMSWPLWGPTTERCYEWALVYINAIFSCSTICRFCGI